jgi:hypothetical protein
MKQLAVFPSDAVARWIDADSLERDPVREEALSPGSGHSDVQVTRRHAVPRPPQLRYRPFERLAALRLEQLS